MANDEKSVVDGILKETDINVAATLRDIAANCDKTTGKVLRLCEEAAHEGKAYIVAKVSIDDRYFLYRRALRENPGYETYSVPPITPLVEKLESLGFKLQSTDQVSWGDKCFIKVSW